MVIMWSMSVRETTAQVSVGNARISAVLAGSTVPDPVGALNPAWAGSSEQLYVTIWIAEPYGMRELMMRGASISIPVGLIGLSASIKTLEFDRFKEHRWSFGISRVLPGVSRAGLALDVVQLSSFRGGYRLIPGVRIGVAARYSMRVILSASINKRFRSMESGLSGRDESARIGIAVVVFNGLTVRHDVLKERLYPLSLRFGIEYQATDEFMIMAGTGSFPNRSAIGIGVHIGRYDVEIAFDRHSALGLSGIVSLGIAL